ELRRRGRFQEDGARREGVQVFPACADGHHTTECRNSSNNWRKWAMRVAARIHRRPLQLSLLIGLTLFSLSCNLLGRAGVRTYFAEPFPDKLSSWRLFKIDGGKLQPNKGVVPYDLNTPLFSDYADKSRHVWMPAGTSATYNRDEVFDFPVGTIISKTFAFPDEKNPGKQRMIETRILVRGKERW